MACRAIENTPEIIAWLAMMVATVASTTIGITIDAGTSP
jgi:hypothetical protein